MIRVNTAFFIVMLAYLAHQYKKLGKQSGYIKNNNNVLM